MGASIVRLNWAAQRLELLPAGTEPARGSVSLPVAGVMHFGADEGMRINWQAATISAVLDGMPIDLGITTWPGSTITNAGFVTENDLLSCYSKHIDYVVPVGITGRAPVSVATARRLELGTASIDAPSWGWRARDHRTTAFMRHG